LGVLPEDNSMKALYCTEFENIIQNLINKDKQLHGKTLFLTLKHVYKIVGKGKVDFGGSEFVEADKELLIPVKINPEDKYGWWELEPGTYHIEFNERFENENDILFILSPSRRITLNGTFHSTVVTIDHKYSPKALLVVGANGISIKENARISLCKVFDI
jgi:hypothetical protein